MTKEPRTERDGPPIWVGALGWSLLLTVECFGMMSMGLGGAPFNYFFDDQMMRALALATLAGAAACSFLLMLPKGHGGSGKERTSRLSRAVRSRAARGLVLALIGIPLWSLWPTYHLLAGLEQMEIHGDPARIEAHAGSANRPGGMYCIVNRLGRRPGGEWIVWARKESVAEVKKILTDEGFIVDMKEK